MIAKIREAVRVAILADKSLTEITRQGKGVLACSRFNQGKDRP